jgi:hypothetical protein
MCFNMLQYVSICFIMLQYASIGFNMFQYVSISLNRFQYLSVCCGDTQDIPADDWEFIQKCAYHDYKMTTIKGEFGFSRFIFLLRVCTYRAQVLNLKHNNRRFALTPLYTHVHVCTHTYTSIHTRTRLYTWWGLDITTTRWPPYQVSLIFLVCFFGYDQSKAHNLKHNKCREFRRLLTGGGGQQVIPNYFPSSRSFDLLGGLNPHPSCSFGLPRVMTSWPPPPAAQDSGGPGGGFS